MACVTACLGLGSALLWAVAEEHILRKQPSFTRDIVQHALAHPVFHALHPAPLEGPQTDAAYSTICTGSACPDWGQQSSLCLGSIGCSIQQNRNREELHFACCCDPVSCVGMQDRSTSVLTWHILQHSLIQHYIYSLGVPLQQIFRSRRLRRGIGSKH